MKILNKIICFFLPHKVVSERTDHDFCYYNYKCERCGKILGLPQLNKEFMDKLLVQLKQKYEEY